MSYKNKFATMALITLTSASLMLAGCALDPKNTTVASTTDATNDANDSSYVSQDDVLSSSLTTTLDTSDLFSERDLTQTYDASEAVYITLNGSSATCEDDSVTIEDSVITITSAGVYVISGTLTDGQIIVDADNDTDKVEIVLDNASLSSSNAACILVKSADKTFITSSSGSTNTLVASGTSEEVMTDDGDTAHVDGTIFSRDDLVIKGLGSLTIESTNGNGIVGKDDVKITGSTIRITAANHGIQANDSIRIAGGEVTINCENDGIHADHDDDESLGYVYMCGGDVTIACGDDGMHASSYMIIDDGHINITKSYEGIEGANIEINGGTISVTADDDGLNAAGGADHSGTMGGFGGDNFFRSSGNYSLSINGGTLYVTADGDGLDSNGNLYINGGTTYISGPTNDGNGALDYGEMGEAVITGGILIAAGSSGMAEQFSNSSTQGAILLVTNTYSQGEICVTDSDGNILCSFTPTKNYNAVNISAPGIEIGGTYTVTYGGTSEEVTMDTITYGSTGMMGMGEKRPDDMGNGQMREGHFGGFPKN